MTAHYHDLAKSSEAVSSRSFAFVDGLLRSTTNQPESDESDVYRDGVKRLLDLALVVLSLPLVMPLILLFAAIVALDGGKPLFRQNRLGSGGRLHCREDIVLWPVVLIAGRHRQQLANRDIPRAGERRHPPPHLVVERQLAPLSQQQHGRRRELLAHRADAVAHR